MKAVWKITFPCIMMSLNQGDGVICVGGDGVICVGGDGVICVGGDGVICVGGKMSFRYSLPLSIDQ